MTAKTPQQRQQQKAAKKVETLTGQGRTPPPELLTVANTVPCRSKARPGHQEVVPGLGRQPVRDLRVGRV